MPKQQLKSDLLAILVVKCAEDIMREIDCGCAEANKTNCDMCMKILRRRVSIFRESFEVAINQGMTMEDLELRMMVYAGTGRSHRNCIYRLLDSQASLHDMELVRS